MKHNYLPGLPGFLVSHESPKVFLVIIWWAIVYLLCQAEHDKPYLLISRLRPEPDGTFLLFSCVDEAACP